VTSAAAPSGALGARSGAAAASQPHDPATPPSSGGERPALLGRVIGPLGATLVAAAGVLVVALVDPHEAGHYPTCPFLWLTGLYCPGCGSLRAVHDLAHLDLAGAWGMNPALVLAVPYLLLTGLAWWRRSVTGAPRTRLAPAWVLWTVLVAICVYWVARNVPAFAPWLAP